MGLQSMYIHGNAVVMRFPGGKGDPYGSPHTTDHQMNGVLDASINSNRIEWSDVVGLRGPHGVTFRGRERQHNTFYAAVPTPSWRDGLFAKLSRVAVRFKSDADVNIVGMKISDGAIDVMFPFPPMSLGGDHMFTWDENVNFFDHPNPPDIGSGVCVEFEVSFAREGDITFCAVGCDFIV